VVRPDQETQGSVRLVRTVGSEVKKELGKGQLQQLFEIGILGLRGFSASDYYILNLYGNPRMLGDT